MNPNCSDIPRIGFDPCSRCGRDIRVCQKNPCTVALLLTHEEMATLKAAVPEFLRNTTMDADHELLENAARIIDRITKVD